MAFGNLFLAALTQMTGSFETAVEEASRFLKLSGRVLPVTLYNTHICAELEDGSIREEEVHVRELNKSPIKRLFLKHDNTRTQQECIDAILNADLLTLGPGSLFTTVIACLLIGGIAEAIRDSRALRVYICNTTTQPGQTDNYTVSGHVQQVLNYLGAGNLDAVMLNTAQPPASAVARLAKDGVHIMPVTESEIERIRQTRVTPILGHYVETADEGRVLWNKQDSVRHDPKKIAAALNDLLLSMKR
jgi:uncharacterized cofD-like protein